MSRFVAQLERCLRSRTPVFVNLDHVRHLEYDAVAILLSVMVRFKDRRINFNGSLPVDGGAREGILESTFFEKLYHSQFNKTNFYEHAGNPTHRKTRVDSDLSARLIDEASRTVWGEPRRCPMVQRVFIELMGNTNNHADLDTQGTEHWYVTVTHLPHRKQVRFSFVDYGVGVFESLERKTTGKFVGILKRLRSQFVGSSNPMLLEKILLGAAHHTATGEGHRGKGLPSILDAFRDHCFSDFVMITNDAIYDSRSGTHRILSPPFAGTFVYWTLNSDNRSLPHAD